MVTSAALLLMVMVGAHYGGCFTLEDTPSFFEYGRCAPMALMAGFHMEKYVGKWYTVRSVPSSYVSVTHCLQDIITLTDGGMLVTTDGVTSEGEPGSTQAALKVVTSSPGGPFLQLRAPFVPAVPYHIVYTDYSNVSCVYSCMGLLGIKAELFWVLSRTTHLPHQHLQHCLNIFASKGLNTSRLVQVEQEDCGAVRDVDEGSGSGESLLGDQVEDVVLPPRYLPHAPPPPHHTDLHHMLTSTSLHALLSAGGRPDGAGGRSDGAGGRQEGLDVGSIGRVGTGAMNGMWRSRNTFQWSAGFGQQADVITTPAPSHTKHLHKEEEHTPQMETSEDESLWWSDHTCPQHDHHHSHGEADDGSRHDVWWLGVVEGDVDFTYSTGSTSTTPPLLLLGALWLAALA